MTAQILMPPTCHPDDHGIKVLGNGGLYFAAQKQVLAKPDWRQHAPAQACFTIRVDAVSDGKECHHTRHMCCGTICLAAANLHDCGTRNRRG
jgi:hypothetical protein